VPPLSLCFFVLFKWRVFAVVGVVVCLEVGCGNVVINLGPRSRIPDGGKRDGIGSLVAYRVSRIGGRGSKLTEATPIDPCRRPPDPQVCASRTHQSGGSD
jgi:hypothetical protein